MADDFIISIRNLCKSFGSKVVLDNMSFNVPKNKISFIIGRSGEGKSVTIKHLVGVLKPDSGEIYIQNKTMHNANERQWSETQKKIGILFQDGALFDSMTVFENISFPLVNNTNMKKKEIETKVFQLLESVELPGYSHKMVDQLSIGEKKRIGLVRALAMDPQIILYDEPTTSMDPLIADLIDKLIVKIQKQRNEKLTSIVISHDIASVMKIADHVFLIHKGKIYLEGPPKAFTKSTDPLITQFLTGGLKGPLEVPLV